MDDMDELPKIIRIQPFYGPSYASDGDGLDIEVTEYFLNHPNIEKIKLSVSELYYLAECIHFGESGFGSPDKNPNYPWHVIDQKGLQLTQNLVDAIGQTETSIYYCLNSKNPDYVNSDGILIIPH
ncbi:MAG: hypothetical protein QM504_06475 [Pseudomonadota bacterium]